MSAPDDRAFMAAALALAARGLGDTWPNPSVGCVIVKDGVVLGRGWTQSGGRPHAETEALKRAGAAAKGATAYVTLEPCSHHGKTPPCSSALIEAGVARVVAATIDPNPKVSGGGIAALKAAGIEVTEGVGKAEADRLSGGFFLKVKQNRPWFTLKTATTLDGRTALANGESRWITGEASRRAVHALRAMHDAILVGSETVLADDPELTCRLEGYAGRPKVRIVLDRRLRTPATAKLVTTAKTAPTWIFTDGKDSAALKNAGAEIISVQADDDAGFVAGVAKALAERGLTRVMIEGGGQVAASFLKAGYVDEIQWFRAPKLIGTDGKAAISALGLDKLAAAPGYKRLAGLELGADTLDIFARA